jgi:hypothetical protein
MLTAAGGISRSPTPANPESNNDANESEKFYRGLDEVNLLEGLSLGTHIFHLLCYPLITYSTELRTHTIPPFPSQHTPRRQDS